MIMRGFAARVISVAAILLEASAEKGGSGRFRTRGIYKSSPSSSLRRRNQDEVFDPFIGIPEETISASLSLGFMSLSLPSPTIPAPPSPAPLIDAIDAASSATKAPSPAPSSAPTSATSAAPSATPSISPVLDTSGEPDEYQSLPLSMSMPVMALPCIVCADGLLVAPDTQVSSESAETCQDVLDFSTSVVGGSGICAEITEAEAVCCPPAPAEEVSCPFCPLGITSAEDLEISNGLTCKFTQEYSQEIASNSSDCEVIQFAEVLCCPEQHENTCHFCPGTGVTNPSTVIPDSGDTSCARAELFALGLNGLSEECGAIKSTEPICCPTRCTFCPEGLEVSADTLLPGGQGVTCQMASEYAPTLSGDDGMCSMTKLAEALCCPLFALGPSIEKQQDTPTSMSMSGVVDYSSENPMSEETLAPVEPPILATPPANPNESGVESPGAERTVAPVEAPILSGIMSPPTAPPLYSLDSPTSAPALAVPAAATVPTAPTVPSPPSSARQLLCHRKALIIATIAAFIW